MSFYLVVKKFMITKNPVVKIQNLFVNRESRPVKSNPELTSSKSSHSRKTSVEKQMSKGIILCH